MHVLCRNQIQFIYKNGGNTIKNSKENTVKNIRDAGYS